MTILVCQYTETIITYQTFSHFVPKGASTTAHLLILDTQLLPFFRHELPVYP